MNIRSILQSHLNANGTCTPEKKRRFFAFNEKPFLKFIKNEIKIRDIKFQCLSLLILKRGEIQLKFSFLMGVTAAIHAFHARQKYLQVKISLSLADSLDNVYLEEEVAAVAAAAAEVAYPCLLLLAVDTQRQRGSCTIASLAQDCRPESCNKRDYVCKFWTHYH